MSAACQSPPNRLPGLPGPDPIWHPPPRSEYRAFSRVLLDIPMKLLFRFGLLLLTLTFFGCATRYIPNTDVEDTDENRKIVSFCEQYRHAVEQRNVPLLLRLASPNYYEDGGNVDASDDMDYDGLRAYLEGQFRDARAIRYEVRYRRISRGKQGRINVDFTYSASYKIPGLKTPEEWRHTVAENRLELIEEKDSFKIVSGM